MSALLCGCAATPEYNPVQAGVAQVFVFNEALKSVAVGMKQEDVHRLLGQEIVTGYTYSDTALAKTAQPITIPNPYKTIANTNYKV